MEERNFRSYYYEKVGFRVVEEKKSLEILLKEKPADRNKLLQFALRFPVPAVHRTLLWKLLLDILPPYLDQHGFVLKQKEEQFQDLQRALRVIVNLPQNLNTKAHHFVLMRHLENGSLRLDYVSQLESRDSQAFITINKALSDIIHCDYDVFWISKGIFELLKAFKPYFSSLVSYTDKLLSMQDEQLHQYLVSQKILTSLPLDSWYESCFMEVLPIIPLQRILDKVLGGSSIIMVFLVIALLTKIRTTVFKLNNVHRLVESFKKITDATAEVVVTEAIQMWQSFGSPLIPGSNNDCLKEIQSKSVHKASIDFKRTR